MVFGAGGAGSAIAYSIAEAGAAELAIVDIDMLRQRRLQELIANAISVRRALKKRPSLAGIRPGCQCDTAGHER